MSAGAGGDELLTSIQARETAELRLLAQPELGDCIHEPMLGPQPSECSRCQARRELRRRSSAK